MLITRVLVIGTPLLWLAWDAFAMARFGAVATESDYIASIQAHHNRFALALILAAGALYWHFFLEP